jgi:O-antigen/teichoic acid export membrane protein
MDLVEQVANVMTVLFGGSFSSALGYFYFEKDSADTRRSVVGTTMLGSALIGAAAGVIGWPFSGVLSRAVFGSDAAVLYIHLIFFAVPLGFILEAVMTWLRVDNRAAVYLVASLSRIVITIAGTIVLVALFRLRVLGMVLTSLTAIAIPAALLGVYCFRAASPRFDRATFARMARFSFPIALAGIALLIIHFGDRFILPHYRAFAELGIYALAYKIGMLMAIVHSSFNTYWGAQVFQIVRREDADIVLARVFTYMILVLSFCGLGLIVCSRPALQILTAPAFRGAAAIIPLIVVAYFVRAIGDFFRALFLVCGRPGYDALCNWIGAAVCLTAYFTLIPRYGMWGAAFATAATFLVIGIVSVVWTYRLRPYRLETARLIKIGAAVSGTATPYALVSFTSLPAQIGWAVLLLAVFPLTLLALRFMTPGERDMTRSAFRRVLQYTTRQA